MMLIGVRVGVRTPIRTGRIEATPKDGFGPVPRGLTATSRRHRGAAPMERTQVPFVSPADGRCA